MDCYASIYFPGAKLFNISARNRYDENQSGFVKLTFVYNSRVFDHERRWGSFRDASVPDCVVEVLPQVALFTNITSSHKSRDSMGQLQQLRIPPYILKNDIHSVWVQMDKWMFSVNVNASFCNILVAVASFTENTSFALAKVLRR